MASRGGKGGAEPRARVQARRLRAWELSIAGWSQRQIAQDLGVSQPAVSKMLHRVGLEAAQELQADLRANLARTVRQCDAIYREAMDAWGRSQTDRTRRRHQRVETESEGGGTKALTEAVVTAREGDPRFLAAALAAVRQKQALLSLFQPQTPEQSHEEQ